MIKCIAIDMDGTLLNEHHVVSDLNKQAIEAAQAKGIEVVIATGRSFPEAKFPLEAAELNCPIIAVNGADVRSISGERIHESPIDQETAFKVMDILNKHNAYYELYTEDGTYSKDYDQGLMIIMDIFMSPNFQHVNYEETVKAAKERFESGLIQLVDEFDSIVKNNVSVYKFITFSFDEKVLAELREALSTIEGIAISSSGKENIEINSVHAQKGLALTEFVAKRNITLEETMAIGDNYNDLSMFQRVGRAVAMGNAPEEVKKHGHIITDTNKNDGVGKAILEVVNQ
ncbi:HAD family phosphatase [Bacillus sp. PS06]|nr:HAD family phosphatase [Bacillus sp. PS06]